MRYAIVSDLHANKPALKSVLADIASSKIDEIICLGDIVGYGPNPAEVLEIAYSKIHHFVLGNHDAVIGGKITSGNFNDTARRMIEWTSGALDGKAVKFFNSLPLELKGGNFRCAHAEFANPGRFGYILEIDEAIDSFDACNDQVMFAGHSHVPGLFVVGKSGIPHWVDPVDFGIEDEKRYIVNVGSVGQPRDDGIRASYCIFDTENRDVLFRKVAFDVDEYIACQKKSKSPDAPTYFVDIYHKQAPRPIRDIIDFRRISAENTVKTDVDVVSLEKTVHKLKKTRATLLISLIILLVGIISISSFYLMKRIEADKAKKEEEKAKSDALKSNIQLNEISKEVKKYKKTVYEASKTYSGQIPPQKDTELISVPEGVEGIISVTAPLDSWTLILTDPEMQRVSVEKFDDKASGTMPVFRISSGTPAEIKLCSIPVPAEKGMRFAVSAQFKKEKLSSGYIELIIEEELSDGTIKQLDHTIPDEINKSDNWTRKKSVTLDKSDALKENNISEEMQLQED
ncbi:MAG: metallophosphoesterase family protein [Lentisphaerae bacterium]|nr:metallophosphoesterase family protein [Lentisphaerota bacterium]